MEIRKIVKKDPEYPDQLSHIYDPPKSLYLKGRDLSDGDLKIAIVGARRCTSYGSSLSFELARDLAVSGATIVSGLARGVDTAAHRGALDGGGATIAVLGCGLGHIYPKENRELHKDISLSGTLVSEYDTKTLPLAYHFPARNRIISGISVAVIVIEARKKSGALITADFAMEQGREVMAVPGNVKSPNSLGCHELIKNGATMITDVDDIFQALGIETGPQAAIKEELLEDEMKVLEGLDYEPIIPDKLAVILGQSINELQPTLLSLELKGFIRKSIGGEILRVN